MAEPGPQPTAPAGPPPPAITGAAVPAAVPTFKRLVVFDPASGQPVVQNVPMFTKQQVSDIIVAAATELYDADPILEPEFVGKTNLEVMVARGIRRAARSGDMDPVLDRIIGKAKTIGEMTKVNVDYETYLRQLAAKGGGEAPPKEGHAPDIVDAQVVDDSPLADLL